MELKGSLAWGEGGGTEGAGGGGTGIKRGCGA